MNRGDARIISLNITIAGNPIAENYADEIELTINPETTCNCVKKKLSDGTIIWNVEKQKYIALLTQEDTFKLIVGNNTYQLRVKKDIEVVSSAIKYIKFGSTNSTEVLVDPETEANDEE